MKHRIVVLIVGSLLTLSACANTGAGRFGGAGAGTDSSIGALGSPTDPTSQAYFNQTIGDRVLFLVDESTLNDQAREILNGQATWMMANAEYTATIEGHADEQGTREYNIALSDRRANAVKEYLVSRGVASSRLSTIPFGKERPISICSDESCYSQNRRAVTILAAGNLGS